MNFEEWWEMAVKQNPFLEMAHGYCKKSAKVAWQASRDCHVENRIQGRAMVEKHTWPDNPNKGCCVIEVPIDLIGKKVKYILIPDDIN